MFRELSCFTVLALSLIACGGTPDSERESSTDELIATADSFVSAFYSYDPDRLRAALSSADDSAASILFYQGWAEGGNYEVVERLPCKLDSEETISCSIVVKDDLMGALGIDFNVTDTFHLDFSNDRIVSVSTSSNDPQAYYDAEQWVEKNRPELVDEPCERSTDRPSTPGDCVRGYVQGFSEFVEAGGLSGGFSQQLSATESDPRALGWMQGSPPPPDRLVMQPDSNFFSFPKLRWTVCHFRELLPTEQVSRGLGAPLPLDYDLDETAIDKLTFRPTGSRDRMTWKESLAANYTDGILVIHEGRIVYERYFGCLDEAGKHGAMSMTKSLTGLLAEMLVVEGRLDDSALVASIVPELADSAFGSATVRQVMDMTTGLAYSEDYADPDADIWIYSRAASPLPKPAGYDGPDGYFEYLRTVKPEGEHGDAFHYKTINTDALGWIVSRVSGMEVTELLSERIWSRIGAEQDAYMTVDAKGTPFAGGGLSAGLRDLGRIGLLMLDEGEINGERLFSSAVVANIRRGGSKEAFAKAGYQSLEGGSYRSMWWLLHNEHGAFAARGVHGQTIYVDPEADMVLVRFASYPSAKNALIDPTSLPAYEAVADYLLSR